MGRKHSEEQLVGDDCFMDTIANLIGILIILVMIVGARSYTSAKQVVANEIDQRREALQQPRELSRRIESDIDDQVEQMQRYEIELANRSMERMMLIDSVTIAKQDLEKRLEELNDENRVDAVSSLELTELQKQLADLLKQEGELLQQQQPAAILQHLPTPMAKTVFGHEIHLMLTKGLVTVIPWNELVETLKREARGAVQRNTQKSQITNTLGPISGFSMKYSLKSQSGMMSDGSTMRMGRLVELDKFVLVPTADILQETLDEALATSGRLRAELASHSDKNVTVTVWVYPDSFQVFRELKERLFPEGYLCAARPLPFGVPIGASPNGASSTAQ
ncbi:hypothetical protein SH467x_004285 [Pirellulaceae bacterium SH467]|jgi:hypothetical protein